ncbi:MAG: T9SS type A sorting domain-containing protein [Saprospiraceae bacterium]|nr:T9SS type A sorting domain-containing protein [Saprospiraceae bacterium]
MVEVIDQRISAVDGLDQSTTLHVRISPNPTSEMIIIEIPENEFSKPCRISIYDMDGKLMMERRLLENISEVNINTLADGIYIVSIQAIGTFAVRKLILKRS